jgi:hypothetical protein
MSEQQMNKNIEFIIEQQAKFAAEIEIMREVQAADAKRLGEGLNGVIDIVGSLARYQMRTEDTVNSLSVTVNSLTGDFSRLAQAQAETAESLKILINVVERHFDGNGGATNSP